MLREIKRRLLAMLPPVIFLAITCYFAWNAVHGARGLEAQAAERAELAKAQASFAAVDATRAEWEAKVAALGDQTVSPDMLDEQARKILSYADLTDLVVNLPASAAK